MEDEKLRIGVLAPAWFAVPPDGYGGIEWVVSILADGLADAGHDVTLFASGGSRTRARLVTTYDEPPSLRIGRTLPELEHTLTAWLAARDGFDVLNDHSGLLAAGMASMCPVPVCHTVHGPLDGDGGRIYGRIAEANPGLRFISLSMNQRKHAPNFPWLANCPNAIPLGLYPFHSEKADFLLFLGRMAADKGAAHAIRAAEALDLPLKLAGKMDDVEEKLYFAEEVEPHLVPGRIEYLGEVPHVEKVRLLQTAACTLFPIEWEEPFGLVMIESMACGTPVVATRCGAVPEVMGHPDAGGVVVDRRADVAGAVEAAMAIPPARCRAYAERHFSADRMVADYVAAYRRLPALVGG